MSPPSLPAPRGPLSDALLSLLTDRQGVDLPALEAVAADPFGDDLQLALYLAYELHYRGFAGVPEDREWDLGVLGLRAQLENRFLDALRRQVPGGGGADAAAVFDGLLRATGEGGASAYLVERGERWQLRELAAHRSLYHLKEADPQAWVIPRLEGALKAALVGVQFDEYGGGAGERMHARLFADLMAELGLDATYGHYLDLVPAPMLAVVNFMSLCGLRRSLRGALIGQFAAVEITSPPGSQRMVAALRRVGCGERAQAFYAEHVVADSVHELVIRRQVVDALLAVEPDLAGDIAFGATASGWLDDRLDAHLLSSWAQGRTSLRRPLPAEPVAA